MHDLVGGRVAWTVLGLPTDGQIGDHRKVKNFLAPARSVLVGATVADVRALGATKAAIAVVDDAGVLLGALDPLASGLPEATAVERSMIPAPGTIRPDLLIEDAIEQLRSGGLLYSFVTTARGELLGVLSVDDHV